MRSLFQIEIERVPSRLHIDRQFRVGAVAFRDDLFGLVDRVAPFAGDLLAGLFHPGDFDAVFARIGPAVGIEIVFAVGDDASRPDAGLAGLGALGNEGDAAVLDRLAVVGDVALYAAPRAGVAAGE